MTREQYRKWYFRQLRSYEKTSSGIVKKHLKNTLIKFADSKPNRDNMQKLLNKSVTEKAIFNMLVDVYTTVGGTHGNNVIKGINDNRLTVKRFFSLWIESFALDVLELLGLETAGVKIRSIRRTLIRTVIDYIAALNDEGESVQVITNEMVKTFGNKEGFYASQVERIVRTETGAAANYASWKAMDDSDLVVDKMWLSADDKRTRDGESKDEYNHKIMNGVTIPHKELFKVPNQDGQTNNVMHPIDMERGAAGNVINCRCTTAPVPRRDKNGRLILKK
jgi:hypothetical protein